MAAPRAYAVGLPVVVEINAEGFVTVSVDLSELSASIWEDTAPIPADDGTEPADDVIRADMDTLSAWARTHAVSGEGYADEGSVVPGDIPQTSPDYPRGDALTDAIARLAADVETGEGDVFESGAAVVAAWRARV